MTFAGPVVPKSVDAKAVIDGSPTRKSLRQPPISQPSVAVGIADKRQLHSLWAVQYTPRDDTGMQMKHCV